MSGLRIGEVAERTGTNTPTIRYYEEIGLLPRPDRQEGNQRRYGDDAVKRLTFIRRCRDFGFSIEQVRTLTSLVQDRSRSCFEARDLAQQHLTEVRVKLKELRELEKSIAGFVESCNVACAGGPGPDCVILEDLGSMKPIAAERRRA
ncbi:HTH-type transcriptional regulator hmrR [Mesorhizobium metallidurans STM 2683]|uniref:HTH-type transcriptional regulator hmrR n=1 Tax=Mesorhizobium metallidurans STM 2683 TaxID=1297569 RepID=M5F1U0_9HYPH|nr:helix-turn-helix domain-containing protein [Mesorhizobium metallidurans]CCV05766.1 HTH-type transcriptional regulator hmrR [Mesorhizobium metallidurans STM 2683]